MLALPSAYASLNLHGRAAVLYGRALEQISGQLERVDASIESIRQGRFLTALVREEARQDEGWVIKLRNLPEAPETYYLMELMASHEFQTALHNYLDLEDLRAKLAGWKTGLDAFDDMIRLRGANYEPLLPEVDARFRDLDARMRLRLEQKKNVGKRLQAMLTAPRPEYLATAEERIDGERLTAIEKVAGADPAVARRVAHLRGVLTFRLRTEYHERLTAAFKDLEALNADLETLTKQYDDFVRARQAATQSYTGYDVTIQRLRRRVEDAAVGVDGLMARQGQMIETVAVHQLTARRDRLAAQQTEARYAVADSYDRAARAQAGEEAR